MYAGIAEELGAQRVMDVGCGTGTYAILLADRGLEVFGVDAALRDEGLLEFRRGRGITVTGTPQHGAVVEQTRQLLHFARTQGYKPDELIQIIQQLG